MPRTNKAEPKLSGKAADKQAIMNAIRLLVHALQVASREAQAAFGLSGAQLFVLQTLASEEAMSVNELAARSHTHQSSVSVVVSRLVKAKLVKRATAVSDARRLELTVTPAGRRLLQRPIVTPQAQIIAALEELPPARLAQLRLLLERLTSGSGLTRHRPPMFLEERTQRS